MAGSGGFILLSEFLVVIVHINSAETFFFMGIISNPDLVVFVFGFGSGF